MTKILLVLAAILPAFAACPVAAQTAATTTAVPVAVATTPVDPARLAAARITVDHIFPPGTYAKVMNGSMNGMLDGIMKASGNIPLSQVAALAGQPPAELAKLGQTTLGQIMAILDPVHDQRTSIIMHATMTAMASMMGELEPSIRAGMSEAYARRFSVDQLTDMNRFFATPSGQAYAANVMTIQTDPAVMSRMQAIVPILMQRLPAIIKGAGQAAASLPPTRKISDLSPAERSHLAQLLGVTEAQLETNAKPAK